MLSTLSLMYEKAACPSHIHKTSCLRSRHTEGSEHRPHHQLLHTPTSAVPNFKTQKACTTPVESKDTFNIIYSTAKTANASPCPRVCEASTSVRHCRLLPANPPTRERRPVVDIDFDEEPFAMNERSVLFEPALAAYGGDRWLEGGEVMSCRRF